MYFIKISSMFGNLSFVAELKLKWFITVTKKQTNKQKI